MWNVKDKMFEIKERTYQVRVHSNVPVHSSSTCSQQCPFIKPHARQCFFLGFFEWLNS
jgi:hypothetical protein